ncbi:MAG: cysteine desulfurase [Crocinitomicaceae bacterium]|nr:cysteine desulfurase [Crocinitomicaceae bacterium]|tara:strand:+ start:802 stop:1932 length:1131 start_codon:yes stop_codon:yes gene_type:complete
MRAYLDNAATTPLDPQVVEEMVPVMQDAYGNPSSAHAFGREVKAKIERSRRSIAKWLNVSPSEIIFTSGGTEADNMAIRCSFDSLDIEHAITTDIEHHATLDTLEDVCEKKGIKLSKVRLDDKGYVDMDHLEKLLASNGRSFVSIMHANNEIGNMVDLEFVGDLCKKYDAILLSDTVQTMAHFPFDFSKLKVHFATCSAHKFHGPKGAGFLYMNKNLKVPSLMTGGGQERGMRPGTENVYGIVGLAKALDVACEHVNEHMEHVKGLKYYMMDALEARIPGVMFNGDPRGNSLYTVLNVSLPPNEKSGMLLFNLDIMGIACSGGSACSSGASIGSHVLSGINADVNRQSVRFSFSRFTTREEIDFTLDKLEEFYKEH